MTGSRLIASIIATILAISLLVVGCSTQQPTAQTPETPQISEIPGKWARVATPAPPAIAAKTATRVSPLLAAVIVGGDLGGGDLLRRMVTSYLGRSPMWALLK